MSIIGRLAMTYNRLSYYDMQLDRSVNEIKGRLYDALTAEVLFKVRGDVALIIVNMVEVPNMIRSVSYPTLLTEI